MKHKFIWTGLMCLVFVLSAGATDASAQARLSGTWVMDRAKSTDIPPDTDVIMTISQSGSKVVVSQKFVSNNGEQHFKETYTLNGKTLELMLDGPNNTKGKGKRTARKTDDGFESVDEGSFSPSGHNVNVRTERKWQLSPDGKTLILEISRTTNDRSRQSRRIFTRK